MTDTYPSRSISLTDPSCLLIPMIQVSPCVRIFKYHYNCLSVTSFEWEATATYKLLIWNLAMY